MQTPFTHLDTRETETTEHFFSHQFLNARVETGNESNQGFDPILEENRSEEWLENHWKEIRENDLKYEEDVNQYITLTLAELATPRCLSLVNDYLVGMDCDAGQQAMSFEDRSRQFYSYKINADFLLLQLGLFHPEGRLLGNAYCDKGEFYYFSAASRLKGMKGGRSALSDVLEKLAGEFEKYVAILRYMKSKADNYLSFHFKISRMEVKELEQTLSVKTKNKRGPGSSLAG